MLTIAPENQPKREFRILLRAANDDAPAGVADIVAFDALVDSHRYGEWFDMIVQVDPAKGSK